VRNLLFPLLGKGPVFGGGGGGGGGGGDSDSGGGGYTSIRDMFDGGGAGKSGDTFGGALGGISNTLGFSPVESDTDRGSGSVYEGPTISGDAGYRQDPGAMNVDASTGFITPAPAPVAPPPPPPPPPPPAAVAPPPAPVAPPLNLPAMTYEEALRRSSQRDVKSPEEQARIDVALALGPPNRSTGYTSIGDLFDGGGPGQSGDTFGGLLGGISNTVGLTPRDPGPGAGAVYEGPNIDGSSGYLQDPGQMTVDPSTGFITSDENEFRPAPVLLDPIPEREPDIAPVVAAPPPPAPPPAPARVEPPPVSMGFLPPQMSMVGFEDVMSPTGSGSVAFDDYFMPNIAQFVQRVPVPQPPAPVPQPPMQMPASDRFGMPLALSQLAPIRGPDLAQFFAPPAPPPTPMYTPAVEPRSVIDPRPVSGVTPFPGPTLSDPKGPGGTTGAIPPGGIGSLVSATPGVLSPIFGRQA
jgi:hypothetical protein